MRKNRKFITLEGIEGAGKSTVLTALSEVFEEYRLPFIATREPGGTPIGEKIRQLILNTEHALCLETELLLLTAARAEHIDKVISPALAQEQWVLSDRFIDASFAYQGGGRNMPLEKIKTLTHWLTATPLPNLTFLLDVPPQVGLTRIKKRGSLDRIEREHNSFFERVRKQYLTLAHQEPQRFVTINAAAPLTEVKKNAQDKLKEYLTLHGSL